MTFKKKFRGYDPAQVDRYIEETAAKEVAIRTAQKERIDQLTDENYTLREQLKKYQDDEQAISQALIMSQNLASELKFDAQKYSNIVLRRAKIFYATWRAYAQTIISSLSAEEVAEFNTLQRKIEDIINAYEGNDIASEIDEDKYGLNVATTPKSTPSGGKTSKKRKSAPNNPIAKIEQQADQVIDLNEIVNTDLTLEEICAELGLTVLK